MTDHTLALSILSAVILIIITAIVYLHFKSKEKDECESEENVAPVGPQPRRNLRNTTARERLRAALAERNTEETSNEDENDAEIPEGEEGEEEIQAPNIPAKKISKKKAEKQLLKAEKRAQIEAQEKAKKEKREREAELEEEKKKKEEEEEAEAAKIAEEERKIREEKERKEKEEYEKMKKCFVVEKTGFDQDEDDKNLLKDFIDYIKTEKVVIIEELGAKFGLRTQAAINRVKDLQESGDITGVLDDRGKFIYISKSELESVSRFVRQRGRITLSELAEASGELISFERVAESA